MDKHVLTACRDVRKIKKTEKYHKKYHTNKKVLKNESLTVFLEYDTVQLELIYFDCLRMLTGFYSFPKNKIYTAV